MPKDKSKAVLMWLDKVLTEAEKNPVVLLQAKKEIESNAKIIEEAVRNALLPEFQPYADIIIRALNGEV